MRRYLHLFFVLISSVLLLPKMQAQSISAQVSSKRVQVGVPFEFAVVISGENSNYNQPYFRDFEVLSGPMPTNNVQITPNGSMTQQLVFSYVLVARKEGKFVIPSSNAIVEGRRMETQPITIEVLKNPAAGGGGGGAEIFIKTTISKSKIYMGEQVLIIQKVYSRHQILQYQKRVQSSYDGFYSQAVESPTSNQLIMENVDGINYFTHEALRTLATANKAGKLELAAPDADVIVRKQNNQPRSVFDRLLGQGGFEDGVIHATGRPFSIEVLPLPESGKPENFNGAVGAFTSRVEIDHTTIKANEAVNLRITLNGKGNIKLIDPPKLALPDAFETYEPKTTETATSKTFDYLIIPRREGEYTLNNFEFSYFDLDAKKYVTIPSPEFKMKILPGAPGSEARVYASQSQIKETENDIRYIKKGDFVLSKSESEFFNSNVHLWLLILPILLLAVLLLLRYNHIRRNSDVVLVKERKAATVAKKQLMKAEKMMQAGKKDEFYSEVLLALNNYLSHKFNIPVAELSKEKVQQVLEQKKVDNSTSQKLMDTLQAGEFAKYAPGSLSGDLKGVYEDTVALVTDIEKQLNRKTA